jgi:CTP synthase (UTP-ammonia lyase)
MERFMSTDAAIRIALVGDYNPQVPAHRAIPLALEMSATACDLRVEFDWMPTSEVGNAQGLSEYDGVWCVPASPYVDMDGALAAIRYARERRLAFLGTCGGFQHALIEFARNSLKWETAEHAETSPLSDQTIITPLSCSLVDIMARIQLMPGSLIAQAYGQLDITERYQCRYGLRTDLYDSMFAGALAVSGRDGSGEVRAVELSGHPFFVATLFQPERAALNGQIPPLVSAFLRASGNRKTRVVEP